MYDYIVIEGNIGAGKTSLVEMIADEYNAKCILEEFRDNPFLPKFYEDPEKYSFPLELSFLAERYHQLNREIRDKDLFKTFMVSDYYFMKSLIFAQTTLADDEYNLYKQLFNIIYKSLPKPDLFVYLHKDVDQLLKNIKSRGRDYEQSIEASYLQRVQDGYFNFFRQSPDLKVLIIETNHIDFVHNSRDYQAIVDHIFDKSWNTGFNTLIL